MILLSLLLAGAAPPQAAVDPRLTPTADVTVTAQRVKQTRDALVRCIAAGCPPDLEIAATLSHAEAQFLDGDYLDARSTLLKGRRRNARHAMDFPVEVSRLHRGLARISSSTGFRPEARISTIDSVDALETGLPANDPRTLAARLAVGDFYRDENRLTAAEDVYTAVRTRAHAVGAGQVEARAMLRTAMLRISRASLRPEYRQPARRSIREIAATTDPALASLRALVPQLELQLALRTDRTLTTAAAVARLGRQQGMNPVLVYAPPLDLGLVGTTRPADNDGTRGVGQRASGSNIVTMDYDIRGQWVDIGFWVAPDGTVRDVDVLRAGRDRPDSWVRTVTNNLAQRRYQPMTLPDDDPGIFKVERFSLVSDLEVATGTRVALRQSRPRVEIVDLTMPAAITRVASERRD